VSNLAQHFPVRLPMFAWLFQTNMGYLLSPKVLKSIFYLSNIQVILNVSFPQFF